MGSGGGGEGGSVGSGGGGEGGSVGSGGGGEGESVAGGSDAPLVSRQQVPLLAARPSEG